MDLKESLADQQSHWYYRSKVRVVERFVAAGGQLLDVGAGSGFFAQTLLRRGWVSTAVCVDTGYPQYLRDGRMVRTPELAQASEFAPERPCTVLMLDLLEHVSDDIGLLREYVAQVAPHSRFVLSVPAFMALWSYHDRYLEHHRRYTRRQLIEVARKAGLRVETSFYHYSFLLLPAWLMRRVLGRGRKMGSDLRAPRRGVGALLRFLSWCEECAVPRNKIAGLTAFCVAVKPEMR